MGRSRCAESHRLPRWHRRPARAEPRRGRCKHAPSRRLTGSSRPAPPVRSRRGPRLRILLGRTRSAPVRCHPRPRAHVRAALRGSVGRSDTESSCLCHPTCPGSVTIGRGRPRRANAAGILNNATGSRSGCLDDFLPLACSGDDDDESSGTTTTTEAGSERPTTSSGDGESTATTDDQGTPMTNGSKEPCTETDDWNTEPEELQARSTDPIYLMDAGRHDAPQCFDQLTFRLNGAADVGYYVGYADGSDVRVEGDQLLPTAGDAALIVDISAPVQGGPFDQTGHQPGVTLPSFRPDALLDKQPRRPQRHQGSPFRRRDRGQAPRSVSDSWSAWTVNVRSQCARL